MAKINKKGNHLEEKYHAIKQERADKFAKSSRAFCMAVIALFLYFQALIVMKSGFAGKFCQGIVT
ncbi:MAG: hypothetical protein K2O32_12210 [Acetatifactor sp.]|nr:hypothetical protein [Acetatifactor sp.]